MKLKVLKEILELTKKSSQSRDPSVNLKPSDIYEDDNIRYTSSPYAGCLQPRPNASTLKPPGQPDFYEKTRNIYLKKWHKHITKNSTA